MNLGSILVVDDEVAVRTLLREALAGLGYEVDTADGGSAAIDKCSSRRTTV